MSVHWNIVITGYYCNTKCLNQDSFMAEIILCLYLLFNLFRYHTLEFKLIYMKNKILLLFAFSHTNINHHLCSHFYSIFTQRYCVRCEIQSLGPVELHKTILFGIIPKWLSPHIWNGYVKLGSSDADWLTECVQIVWVDAILNENHSPENDTFWCNGQLYNLHLFSILVPRYLPMSTQIPIMWML